MAGFVSLTDIFVQVTQGKVRDAEQVKDLYRRWLDEIAPGADGWLSLTAGVTEDDEIITVTRFASELAARANSQRSEQTRWWQELEDQLATRPITHNCKKVATFGESRPDNPGFVHVVQGTTTGLAEVMERVAETAQHHIYEHHLDVIGGLIADHGDGGFSELIYYPSDEAARHPETGGMPETGVTLMERLADTIVNLQRFNLHTPIVRHH